MGDSGRDQMAIERIWPVCKSNYGAFVLHAIDATPARWRGDVGSSQLDGASDPTHWLISTQDVALEMVRPERFAEDVLRSREHTGLEAVVDVRREHAVLVETRRREARRKHDVG